MKRNALKVIGDGITNGGKTLLAAGKKHAGGILLAINLVSTGVLIYEVWTRKEKIEKAIEETKDAPLKEKIKKVGKEAAPVAAAAAVATGSAIGVTVVAAKAAEKLKDMTVKATEATTVANQAMNAKDAYQEATKEAVGEEKEKEIREKAAEKEKEKRDASTPGTHGAFGTDIYYDETNPGYEFRFNDDRVEILNAKINRSTDDLGESVTLDMVYNWQEELSNDVTGRASFSDEIGWPRGTNVKITAKYDGKRNGRALYKLTYDPAPVQLSFKEDA